MRQFCMGFTLLLTALVAAGGAMSAQSGDITTWAMPFADAFPGGIALDGEMLYIAASGGMEVLRLDSAQDMFRSWGVSEHPQDVVVVNGIPFCTVREANHITYFHPDSRGVTTASLPFPDLGIGEIHRGVDTDDGNVVFWIAEAEVHGLLRFQYDPSVIPGITGTPSDSPATRATASITPRIASVEHEVFSYDVSQIPVPYPLPVADVSVPFAEWRLPLEDDTWITDLAVADDGTVWISAGLPFLFRFDPLAETIQTLETIQNVSIFQGLLPAPDGSVWFSNLVEGSIGHFHPGTGLSEVWRIPGTGEVYDLAFDAQGDIWYTDRIGNAIGRLSPSAGEALVYDLTEDSEPLNLLVDDAGNVWFSAGSGNYVARLHPS